jgi:hypothetical protein
MRIKIIEHATSRRDEMQWTSPIDGPRGRLPETTAARAGEAPPWELLPPCSPEIDCRLLRL